MKYIKTYESLKSLHKDDFENLQNGKIDYTYMVLNETYEAFELIENNIFYLKYHIMYENKTYERNAFYIIEIKSINNLGLIYKKIYTLTQKILKLNREEIGINAKEEIIDLRKNIRYSSDSLKKCLEELSLIQNTQKYNL